MTEEVAGIILAAGESSRLGKPKQLLEWNGDTLVNNTIRVALESNLNPIILVLGAYFSQIKETLIDSDRLRVVKNSKWKNGQSTSLIAGINALENKSSTVIYMLCDQPMVSSKTIKSIVTLKKSTNADVVMLRTNGKRTPPVLFSTNCFERLLSLEGDKGAREIVDEFKITYLENDNLALVEDIDTQADYASFVNKYSHSHYFNK